MSMPFIVLESERTRRKGYAKFCLVAAQGRSKDVALHQAHEYLKVKEKLGITWANDNIDYKEPGSQRNYKKGELYNSRKEAHEMLRELGFDPESDNCPKGYEARNMMYEYAQKELEKGFFQTISDELTKNVKVSCCTE